MEDEPIPYEDNPIPKWLILTYIVLPIWGIIAMIFYWNGSADSWLDRGYWGKLQQAANTTYPYINESAK